MTEVTERDPGEMDHDELRSEWSEAKERLFHPSLLSSEEEDKLGERASELWSEMRSRVDAEGPECPKCGGQRWGQEYGGPKHCKGCDYHPTLEEEDLIQDIDDYWSKVRSGPQEAEA